MEVFSKIKWQDANTFNNLIGYLGENLDDFKMHEYISFAAYASNTGVCLPDLTQNLLETFMKVDQTALMSHGFSQIVTLVCHSNQTDLPQFKEFMRRSMAMEETENPLFKHDLLKSIRDGHLWSHELLAAYFGSSTSEDYPELTKAFLEGINHRNSTFIKA